MIKTIMAAVFILIFFAAVNAQQITVTSPKVGDKWCIGSPYTITWTKSGTMPDTVAIRLRRVGAPESELAVADLTASTPNDGSFAAWTVPASVPAGDYFMRVRTKNPSVIGDSATFSIVAPLVLAPFAKIEVMAIIPRPDLAVCLAWGGKQPLIWQKRDVTVRVKNIGKAVAPATTCDLYVEGHGTGSISVPGLAINQEVSFTYTYSWPTVGHKTVRATVDPAGQVKEAKENNNMISKSIKVRLPHENTYVPTTDICSD